VCTDPNSSEVIEIVPFLIPPSPFLKNCILTPFIFILAELTATDVVAYKGIIKINIKRNLCVNKKITKLFGIIFGVLLINTSYAAETNFTGPSIGVKVSAVDNDVDYGGFLDGISSSNNDVDTELYASYGFALSGNWVVNLGATYSLTDTDFDTESYLDGGSTETIDVELEDHWSVYIEPGYKFTDKWLGFAKLAYHDGDANYRDSLAGNGTTSVNGIGYGIGVAYAYSRNIEARLEYQEIDYDRERVNLSTGELDVSEFSVSIGYRF